VCVSVCINENPGYIYTIPNFNEQIENYRLLGHCTR